MRNYNQASNIKLDTFCRIWNLKSLGNEPTCFKNPNNFSCIDLILANTIKSFQETQVFETGISEFHIFLKPSKMTPPPQKKNNIYKL